MFLTHGLKAPSACTRITSYNVCYTKLLRIVKLSALKNDGLETLLDTVLKVKHQLEKRVETSTLNAHLTDWVEENEAPRSKKGRYRIKYMTQVSAAPVKFLLFVNNKKGFPEFYLRYILNMISYNFV